MNTTAFILGFHALFAQALALREIELLFSAGEISISGALAAWLFWTAAGISLAGRGGRSLPFWTAFFATACPPALALARSAALPLAAAAQPGLFETLLLSALLSAPFALLNGAAIGAGLRSLSPQRFYLSEALGAAAGGLCAAALFTFLPGADYVAACAVTAAAALLVSLRAASTPRPLAAVAVIIFTLVSLLSWKAAAGVYPALYGRGTIKEYLQSRLTRLVVFERAGTVYAAENGFPLGPVPAGEGGEMPVHLPLLAHPAPGSVLLLGPAAPVYAALARDHSPALLSVGTDDPAAAARLLDLAGGGAAICRTEACLAAESAYDAVIVPAGDPSNSSLNRFYTVEFMAAVKRSLKPGGVAAFSFTSAENYLSPSEAYAAACLRATARSVFPRVAVIPGARAILLASGKDLTLEPATLAGRLKARGIKAFSVKPETLPFILHPYRSAWYSSRLDAAGETPVNSALRPLAYFLSWKVWLSMYADPGQFLGLAALAMALLWGTRRLAAGLAAAPSPTLTAGAFLAGAWGMAFEICVMLAWEARLGTLASSLGLVFALFLGGMAAGAAAFRRRGGLALSGGLMAAVSAAAALWLPRGFSGGTEAVFAASCSALLAAGGFAAGSYFPAAARRATGGAGAVYSADLRGGAAGGLIFSAAAVPLLGIKDALWACSAIGALSILPLAAALVSAVIPRKTPK